MEGLAEPFGIEDIMPGFPDMRETTIRCLLDEFSGKGRLEVSGESGGKIRWVKRI